MTRQARYFDILDRVREAHVQRRLFVSLCDWDDRRLKRCESAGLVLRLYRHVFALPDYWEGLPPDEKIRKLAWAISTVYPDTVFCGATAALLLGLGSCYPLLGACEILSERSSHRDAFEWVAYRRWRAGDTWNVGPYVVTEPRRTVADIARTAPFRYALGYADALVREYGYEDGELREFARCHCRGLHGIRRIFEVADCTDGKSDNGGESEARAVMILAGIETPVLQVEIDRLWGGRYYLADFGWRRSDGSWLLGELHGLGKFMPDDYVSAEDRFLNGELAPAQEKASATYRDALIRDANLRQLGHKVIHFKLSDTYDVEAFGRWLRRMGAPSCHIDAA